MTQIKDGGPAFPQDYKHTEVVTRMQQLGEMSAETLLECTKQLRGMSIRDYLAAKALPVAWSAYDNGYTGQPECVEQSIAHHAYQIADAMLRARSKP